MLLKSLREQVLETCMRMLADGIAHDSQGNISAVDGETGSIAITPSAIPYKKLKVEDICIIDRQRQPVDAKWKPTSEIAVHMAAYARRADVLAVVHSHAPYSTVFGVTYEPLPVILTEAATCLGAVVPVAPYRRPGTEELAEVTAETLGAGMAVIMAHHGLVTVGGSLAQAYEATLACEDTAWLTILARSMGVPVHTLDAEEAAAMREIYLKHYKATPLEDKPGDKVSGFVGIK